MRPVTTLSRSTLTLPLVLNTWLALCHRPPDVPPPFGKHSTGWGSTFLVPIDRSPRKSGNAATPTPAATVASASRRIALRTHERAVLDAVRLPVRPMLLAHLLFVRLVVAFEPAHPAVAFEHEHVRRDAVEEPAIAADHHDAAGEIEQRVRERAGRVHIEVVPPLPAER